MSNKVLHTKEIQTAAELKEYLEGIEALGYDLETVHLQCESVSFIQEKLSDRSLVYNVSFNQ